MELTKADKAVLKPFGDLVAQMHKLVDSSSDDELTALISAASRATNSNCWWATYRAAQQVSEIASVEKRRRATLSGDRPKVTDK